MFFQQKGRKRNVNTEIGRKRRKGTWNSTVIILETRFNNCAVVPTMNGHPRDQAKVSVHGRWPLIRGTGGQVKDATYNIPRLSPPAIFILNACIVIIMYAIVIKPKIDAT